MGTLLIGKKKGKSAREKTKGRIYNIHQFVNGFLLCFFDGGLQFWEGGLIINNKKSNCL